MIERLALEELKNNPNFIKNYGEGIALLKKSGIFDFLRIFSQPVLKDGGRDIASAAAQAAHSNGYNKCIDDLTFFNELYLKPVDARKTTRLDFGGRALAIARGDILPGELDAKPTGPTTTKRSSK